jgi:hypothetical protein
MNVSLVFKEQPQAHIDSECLAGGAGAEDGEDAARHGADR